MYQCVIFGCRNTVVLLSRDMDRRKRSSSNHLNKGISSFKGEGRGVMWEKHRSSLDELFFRECDFIRRGSQDYKDFWLFLDRYEAFQKKHVENHPKGEKRKDVLSPNLELPKVYNRRYKINVALLSKDVSDVTKYSTTGKKKVSSASDKKREKDTRELSSEEFSEFKSILLFYIDFCQKQKFAKLVKLKKDQENLPISQFRQQIISAVQSNQVVIIAGDTGCGKSTQVPQYLLHAGFTRIACTQPRRIACISLAKRVGYETLNEYRTQVAYQIRFEASKTRATRILFLTEGLLLRQLSSDPTLSQYSVVVVDEVHERHVHGDFLLGVLRGLLQARADLKLVLMSATINISLFAGYFTGAPVIQIPGRLFPIEVRYQPPKVEQSLSSSTGRERLDPSPYLRIMQLIDHKYPSTERGDVLMFLSGMSEISAVVDAAREYAQQSRRWIILALHSSLSVEEQDKAFDVAPEGVRKCVVATNIAETSITIDGIRFIVDSGKVKEMSFDPQAKMQRLREFWISQASAEQRKGRAGRTGPGVCFRLYSESDYQAFSQYTTPEIQRVPLDSIILQMVSLGITFIRDFPFIEPPPPSNVENSIHFLKQQGALTDDENLTPIGQMLAQLPVDVVIGKMLLIGSVFHVIEPVMVIAAALSVQSPFTRRLDHDPDVTSLRQPLESDHGDPFTLLNAYDEWLQVKSREGSSRKWCKRRGLEEQRFYEMSKLKRQFEELLRDHGLRDREGRDRDEEERDRDLDKRRKLKRLKRDHRTSSRKTKMLKLNEDEQSGSEEEPGTDIRDLEFKLTHDLDRLQAGSTVRRSFTLREINLLKIILCSGLYPNLAVPDESNTWKRDSEQLFHSQSKQFLLVHPTSVFVTRPELLQPVDQPANQTTASKSRAHFSPSHQLLAFVSLLETNKPYLVNAMRVPALQTLLLFARGLDTNADLTRFVVDTWLEICLPDSATGQKVVNAVQQLRVTWSRLLKLRFEVKKDAEGRLEKSLATQRNKERDLERLLAKKLSEFLDSNVRYSLRRLLPSEDQHLYLGPEKRHDMDTGFEGFEETLPFAGDLELHPVKGGLRVNEYLTYNCLQDTVMAEAASAAAQYLSKHWRCESCGEKMIVTVLERLKHQEECDHEQPSDPAESDVAQAHDVNQSDARDVSVERLKKPYFCGTCQSEFSFTSTEILKHRKSHLSKV